MKTTLYIDTKPATPTQPAAPGSPPVQRTLGQVDITPPGPDRIILKQQVPTPMRFEDFVQTLNGMQGTIRTAANAGAVVAIEFVDGDPAKVD